MSRHRSKHTRARSQVPTDETVGTCIERVARQLARHPLVYGHGTENPLDEAAALVFAACGYEHDQAPEAYQWTVSAAARTQLETWVHRRLHDRVPSAYLTGMTSFAGEWYRTDPRALIPRSPLAEVILESFHPFIHADRVKRVLDIGTGSGCIAIAIAKQFPQAQVDAVDVSAQALELARVNAQRLGVAERVRFMQSDVYSALDEHRYDIIISNPPYVPKAVVDGLPKEYQHEPRSGLEAGEDGLSIVTTILEHAHRFLNPKGLLLVEVGETAEAVMAHYADLPFLWLSFHNGGDGVFLLTREQCPHGR